MSTFTKRADGSTILPTDPDALCVLVAAGILEVAAGILEVVQEAENEEDVLYRMPDPEGVARALAELRLKDTP